MINAKYIKTMDFMFENVSILNCEDEGDVADRIRNNIPLKIRNNVDKEIEYINTAYIMYYGLEK